MTFGVLNQALQGMASNQRRFERAADAVVRATTVERAAVATDGPDLATSIVDLMTARRGFEACLAVARSSDEMLGSVIDVLA